MIHIYNKLVIKSEKVPKPTYLLLIKLCLVLNLQFAHNIVSQEMWSPESHKVVLSKFLKTSNLQNPWDIIT